MTTTGNAFFRRGIRFFAAVLLLGGLIASGAAAQTNPVTCALDSLYLVSPNEIQSVLVSEPMLGVELSWPEMPDAISACAVPADTAGLGFQFFLEGDYAGKFDRTLDFISLGGGVIGSQVQDRVVFSWSNPQTYTGDMQGEINLSNSGGFYRYSFLDDSWTQFNSGLPANLPYTDIKTVGQSTRNPGLLIGQLSSREFVRGLWRFDPAASSWARIAENDFPDGLWTDFGANSIAISPLDDNNVAIATQKRGIMVSHDGGDTFVEHSTDIDSGSWFNRPSKVAAWTPGGDLFVGIRNLGLFVSYDAGDTYTLLDGLRVPSSYPDYTTYSTPIINDIVVIDDDHLLVAVVDYGIYETIDGGANWTWVTENLLADVGSRVSASTVCVDPDDSSTYIIGTSQLGLWRTDDGGTSWAIVGEELLPEEGVTPPFASVFFDPSVFGRVLASGDNLGILVSNDSGATWAGMPDTPTIDNSLFFEMAADGSGDLFYVTYGGGIYVPGTRMTLSSTIIRNLTEAAYKDLQFGLDIGFSEGQIDPGSAFRMVLQDFQGYAVWRSNINDQENMQLIGLFDKNNPETCIIGYCGDDDFSFEPGCFAEKRSACFDFSNPDTVRFFDADIYDGFVYYYAVTTFDYGNTSNLSESGGNLINDQLFSPRFNDDPNSFFNLVDDPEDPSTIDGNLILYEVNLAAKDALMGPEIYVVPNPLREGVGFPELNGEMVEFRNLPPESKVKVFTIDGDLVADIGSDAQEGHNIKWVTRNPDNKLLASGVYIWRVEMPQREPFFGKLVIIR